MKALTSIALFLVLTVNSFGQGNVFRITYYLTARKSTELTFMRQVCDVRFR